MNLMSPRYANAFKVIDDDLDKENSVQVDLVGEDFKPDMVAGLV